MSPASKLPSGGSRKRTAARKQNTKMPTITGSGSSRREGQGQQQQSQTKPSAGSAEEAITAITRVRNSGTTPSKGQQEQEDLREKRQAKPLSKWDIYSMSKAERVDAAVDEFLNGNPGQSIPSILQKYGIDHSTLYQGVTAMGAPDRPAKGKTGGSDARNMDGSATSSTAQKNKKTSASKQQQSPPPQPTIYQERDPRLRSSNRIKDKRRDAAAKTRVVTIEASNTTTTTTTTTSLKKKAKKKKNNNNALDIMKMTPKERGDAAWEEYLSTYPRPSGVYFAEKYGIHKSTLSARKLALKKHGVDLDMMYGSVSADAIARAKAKAKEARNRAGRNEVVVDLRSDSDSDMDQPEGSESEEEEEEEEEGDEVMVNSDLITAPQHSLKVPAPPSSSRLIREGKPMELSEIQERYLVNWYLREESLGKGAPSRAKLTSMALSLLFDGQEVQLNPQDEEWLGVLIQRFLERNPEIKAMVGKTEEGDVDGIVHEEIVARVPVPAAAVPAPGARKKKKPEDKGTRALWEPSAAETAAAAAAAAMGYVSNEEDWEDEESNSEEEQTESDDSASDSEESEDGSEEDSDSDSDADSDTSTDISTDDLYNQAFVDSLFVKLEKTPPPPPLSQEGEMEVDISPPIPQSADDIRQHYLSALQDSQSPVQTAQIVKALCVNAGKALDLQKTELEALWEKVQRLERENAELKAKVNTGVTADDDEVLDDDDEPFGPGFGFGNIAPTLFPGERRMQEKQQHQQQQEEQDRKRLSPSSSRNRNMSSETVSDAAAERENTGSTDVTTTTTTIITSADKAPTPLISSSQIPPSPGSTTPQPLFMPVPPRPERQRKYTTEPSEGLDAPDTNQRRLALARRLLGLRLEADKRRAAETEQVELQMANASPVLQESIYIQASGEENQEQEKDKDSQRIEANTSIDNDKGEEGESGSESSSESGSEESKIESESSTGESDVEANDDRSRNERTIIRLLPTLGYNDDDTHSKIVEVASSQDSRSNSRKRPRVVDIEIVLETRKMFGFDHFEDIGPWTGGAAYTIGPGEPGTKRRRITERQRQQSDDGVITVVNMLEEA